MGIPLALCETHLRVESNQDPPNKEVGSAHADLEGWSKVGCKSSGPRMHGTSKKLREWLRFRAHSRRRSKDTYYAWVHLKRISDAYAEAAHILEEEAHSGKEKK